MWGEIKNRKHVKQNIINLLLLIFVSILLLLYWKAELQECDRPVTHRVEALTNEFELTVGEIRGIYIKRKEALENVNLRIVIEDKNGRCVWEKRYPSISIRAEYTEVDHFYPENLIDVSEGRYIVRYYVNDLEDCEIRGKFVEYRHDYSKYYASFFVIVILYLVFSMIIIHQNKWEMYKVYFFLAILTGIFYGILFPALSMPDEASHFLEAYRVSSRIMGETICDAEGYILLRADDHNSMTYLHNIDSISEWYDSTIRGSLSEYVPSNYKSTVSIKAKYTYYIPSLGITLARAFGWSGRVLLSLGRLFNLFFTAGVIALAIRITPKFKPFFAMLGLLPETVMLMNSYSYDAINMSLSILIVAYFIYLHNKEKISYIEVVLFLGILMIFMPIKIAYLPFLLLVILLPKCGLNIRRKKITLFGGLVIGVALIWGGLSISNVLSLAFSKRDNIAPEQATLINLYYVIANIKQIVLIYSRTFFENTYSYIQSMFGIVYSITRGGEMTAYAVPSWIVFLILSVLAVTLLGDEPMKQLRKRSKLLIIVVVVASVLAVTVSMLFACTMTNHRKIAGIQGRYFLPLLPLLPLLISSRKWQLNDEDINRCLLVAQGINLCFAWTTLHFLVTSYFSR